MKDSLETSGFLYSFVCRVQVKASLCGCPVQPPFWAFIWFVFQLIHFALAQDGEKLRLTVRLPSSRVGLLGAEVAKESLCCMATFPSRIHFSFVCFPGYFAPRPLAEPCMQWAHILIPQLPAGGRHSAHACGVCVCACVCACPRTLTYVDGDGEPRGWSAQLLPTGNLGCSIPTGTQMFSVPLPRRQHKAGILWKGTSEETLWLRPL